MSEFHYALGLDIGIGSVGWAVLRNQPNGEPDRIQDLGVRIFDKAEQPKTGASLAAPRRDARSARRRLRRHRHRLERIRYLMEQRGIMPVADIQAMYAAGGFQKSPYQLRAEALDRPLTKEEAVRVLIQLAQRRGYKSNSTAEAAKDEKETGKVKTAIEENRRCMAEHGYRTVGEMMYRDERFWQKHPDGTRYHQTRNKAEDYRFTVERAAIVDEALLPLSFSKYGSLSVQAMQKLIPLLEEGLRYDEACTRVYGDHRGLHPEQRKNRLSLTDMDEITNPVVRRAVSQTIKVINAVVRTYGPPDVVRIELAREMSRTFDERRKMEKRQDDNRAANERAKDQIAEYKGDHATGLDIVKFKLYREQDGVCLYSGQNLDIARLFEPGYADVDHIIPYSRCFDDSYQNKVLVLASENRQKGNRLPYEYFGQDEARWHGYEVRVENLIHNYRKRQKLLKRRLTEEESSGFIDRNLKDTQYITRAVYNLIRDHLAFAESNYRKKPVQAVNGAVTAMLRGRWGVQKIREDGDLHHCLDAAVIAATTPGLVQRLTAYNKHRETWERSPAGYVDPATGEMIELPQEARRDPFPKPWERFRQELEARLDPIDPRHQIDLLKLETYESDEEIKPVFVSRMPNHKVTGAAHAETIRSSKGGDGFTVTKTPLTNLKLNKFGEIEGYYNPASDTLLYDALLARLKDFGGDGAKAFAQPFYKPKKDGSPGPRVDKVKICEKATVGLPVRDGIAANGSMVRIDVFYVEGDGYYFVPIYVADTKKESLPNKAAVAMKPYNLWKKMKDENFVFSLYPGDLVRIQSRKGIKLNLAKGGTGEKEIVRQEGMYYYRSAGIAVAQISVETHDRRYLQPSLGIKTLQSIEKYQVDVLGNYYKVDLPEKRMTFSKEG